MDAFQSSRSRQINPFNDAVVYDRSVAGKVSGAHNPSRVVQRRTYGLTDTAWHHVTKERKFLSDYLLVRIHLIIEMKSVDRPCTMGVEFLVFR